MSSEIKTAVALVWIVCIIYFIYSVGLIVSGNVKESMGKQGDRQAFYLLIKTYADRLNM